MNRYYMRVCAFSIFTLCATNSVLIDSSTAQQQEDVMPIPSLDGIWTGSWGGGESDGVVFQPVVAELYINGTQFVLSGFPEIGRLSGMVRREESTTRLRFIPTDEQGAEVESPPHGFTYVIESDRLTLTDNKEKALTLIRVGVVKPPLANASLELVSAVGVSDTGELMLTEFNEVEVGRDKATAFEPIQRTINLDGATIFEVRDDGCVELEIVEATELIDSSKPVAIVRTTRDRQPRRAQSSLWKAIGHAAPQGAAVQQTLAKTLRIGTLVFVVSEEIKPIP